LPDFDNCELWQKFPAQAGYQAAIEENSGVELSE
jgi:hypothetical protein